MKEEAFFLKYSSPPRPAILFLFHFFTWNLRDVAVAHEVNSLVCTTENKTAMNKFVFLNQMFFH